MTKETRLTNNFDSVSDAIVHIISGFNTHYIRYASHDHDYYVRIAMCRTGVINSITIYAGYNMYEN